MVWLLEVGIKLKENKHLWKRFIGYVVLVIPCGFAAWIKWKTERKFK